METKGNISIHAQNIMPVIKRWLYSDKDIFIREMVSNGCDAITKYQMLKGDTGEDLRVTVTVDKQAGELRFTDNGIGMTAEEVEKYINQVAFSSAEEFLKNYTGDDKGGIIGHFGLGFYSAFMAADKVTIDTLSWQEGAEPVLWESEDGMAFSMRTGGRRERGTTITLHILEDEKEFLDGYRVREVLDRYCGYMAVPIYLETVGEEAPKEEDHVTGTEEEEKKEAEKPINDVHPLWLKNPKECTEEEYKETYRKLFHTFEEPLFWVHLNVDYPFNLKGILYFPRIKKDFGGQEGEIKLFNRQVFVADNIKEVIPEFLMLLKGVIDCPDLPLNVSRSALQNDGFVRKISDYITKKVADKLSGMCKTDRESYEKYWDDINPFIKFGCIKDEKFAEKMKDYIIYKNLEGKYLSMSEYLEAAKEKHENQIFYVTDEIQQSQYINMFKEQGLDAVMLTNPIDQPFISRLEGEHQDVHFRRIDSELADIFKEETPEEEKAAMEEKQTKLTDIFRKALSLDNLDVKVEKLKDAETPAMITMSEDIRRMQDMMKLYGMSMPQTKGDEGQTLILNANNELVQYVLDHPEEEHTEMFCQQIYDLAYLSLNRLDAEAMTKFISRSNQILKLLTK